MSPNSEESDRPSPERPPLVVDVDRALLNTDLLWEAIVRLAFGRPGRLFSLLSGAGGDFRTVRARAVELADLELEHLPLDHRIQELIAEAVDAGRTVMLLSGLDASRLEMLSERVGADAVVTVRNGPDPSVSDELVAIRELARVFDYVGDAAADPSLLRAANRAHVTPAGSTERDGREEDDDVRRLEASGASRLASLFRALRPHQWSKNGLLLLPILAAHLPWNWGLVADTATALASFSLLASAVYLANDLADLPHDRRHPRKRDRPLASGDLSIPAGSTAVVALIGVSGLLALRLPLPFAATLGAYLLLNVGYSFGLKRVLVLDVILLATLYTVRVIAGAALAQIELTGWFLAFSVFLFLSLAVLKRVVELERTAEQEVAGRSYRSEDLPILRTVGPACGVMAALVYCLYITGPVRELYDHPIVLWVGLPVLLYWIVRVWLLALRGEVHEDPVVFVVRDRVSHLTLLAFLTVVFLAA